MVESIDINGRRVWIKRYAGRQRRLSLGALEFVARRLRMVPLLPPPHRVGVGAATVEARRLSELAAQQVHVPEVIGQGRASLVLSDNGNSLAQSLREADDAGRDHLVRLALQAIAQAHAGGAYFGQPVPRNMTWDGERIGFIDFEEDPLEVMDLAQAQSRDWLMFGYGVAKYYDSRSVVLEGLIREAMAHEQEAVQLQTHEAAARLRRFAKLAARLGSSARTFAQAIIVLHGATMFGVLLALVLLFDLMLDGDLDLARMLF